MITHRTRMGYSVLLAAALIAALTGCMGGSPETTASPTTTPTSSTSVTATPTPTPTPIPTETEPTASVVLPTDCATLGTDQSRTAVLSGLDFQGADYSQFVRPVPASATLALGCDWFAGDATGLLILISTASEADVAAAAAALPAEGYTCTTDDFGAPVCQKTTPNSQYPVDTVETVVGREGVWVYMQTSNLDGTPLLSDVIDGIFSINQG